MEEYDSEPDFSDLTKIGIAYTNATDEEIPIQVNVDLVGYRVERYMGEVLIDERQYESLENLTETELEALDFRNWSASQTRNWSTITARQRNARHCCRWMPPPSTTL